MFDPAYVTGTATVLAAIVVVYGQRKSKQAVEQIHLLVNSNLQEVKQEVEELQVEIRKLTTQRNEARQQRDAAEGIVTQIDDVSSAVQASRPHHHKKEDTQ